MSKVSIELGVETGGFISGMAAAQRSVSSLTEAMKKAQQEERWDDYDRLAMDRDKLQSRNASFERDIRSFANNPQFQTPGGGTVLKVDAEYAGLIKSQIDAMKQWTVDYEKAVRNGDMTTVRELSPRIEKQQADFHKVIEQANAPTDETRRTANPVEGIGQSVGGLISSAAAAKDSLRELDREIEKAQKTGNDQKAGYLSFAKSRLEAASHGFERDTGRLTKDPRLQQMAEGQLSGQTLSKDLESLASELHNNSDKLSKSTAALIEAVKTGSPDEIMKQAVQFGNQAEDFHKVVQNATVAGQGAKEDAVKGIGINQITGVINEGFSRWVGSLDRSGVINQYGSGDIWGGRIAEERRQADFAGGIAQTGLGLVGAIAGSLIPGVGTMAGAAVGTGVGKALDSVFHIGPNEEASEAAYAGLWQNRSGQAMELAAVMGTPGDVRGSFKTAADTAARYGYSAEEGMEAMKEAARQGLGGQEAADITSRVFDYERRTGADRGTLTGISTMSARYGAGDALGMGWAGMQASGMKPGQYNEYLRAMQRVMEEGISKGFIRSSEQVVENLTMLAQMTNNDPLWQGENGARRLSEMNAGLEGATGLSSTSDILAFRAAREIAGGDSYIDAMKVLEGGLTPDLFKKYMSLTSGAESGGREGIVERLRQTFGLNYTSADKLYKAWENPEIRAKLNDESLKAIINNNKNEPPPPNSPELEAAKITEAIKNWWTQTGISHWDANFPNTLLAELRKAKDEYNNAGGGSPTKKPVDTSGMPPDEAVQVRQREYMEALDSGDRGRADRAAVALEKTHLEALSPKPVIDPIDEETKALALEGNKRAEIERMLLKSGGFWDSGRSAFFTGDANPFTKNDDERAFDKLKAYEQFPEARQSLDKAYDIMRSMTPDQVKKANESNAVNSAIPQDIMTDRTGQALLRAIENMKITIEESP